MRIPLNLSIAVLVLGWAGLHAQETLSSVQRELDRVDRDIQREKELHKQERKRSADFEQNKAQKLQALQDQSRIVQARIDSLKREVDKARRQKTAHKSQAQFFANKEKEFRQSLSSSLLLLASDLRADFPYQREKRAADCEELAKSIEDGITPTEEALNRLAALLSASLDFASDLEVYSGVYTAAEGGSHEGTYIRLGAAFLGFLSQDGQLAALIRSDSTRGYRWEDNDIAPAIRTAFAEAIRVAQGKETPRLVSLPVRVGGLNLRTPPPAKAGQDSASTRKPSGDKK